MLMVLYDAPNVSAFIHVNPNPSHSTNGYLRYSRRPRETSVACLGIIRILLLRLQQVFDHFYSSPLSALSDHLRKTNFRIKLNSWFFDLGLKFNLESFCEILGY